jgi:hypothetical protein
MWIKAKKVKRKINKFTNYLPEMPPIYFINLIVCKLLDLFCGNWIEFHGRRAKLTKIRNLIPPSIPPLVKESKVVEYNR